MRSSSIYIKFNSEAEFERLTFPSQVVSCDEIKKHLEKKKQIVFADKKTDKIALVDMISNKEITEGFIEANTRVIVYRTPLAKSDPIEFTYNPKQTGENAMDQNERLQDQKEAIEGSKEEDFVGEENIKKQEEDKQDSTNTIKFMTSKIDLSLLGQEFMCPMPNPNETKNHLIIDPVIFSCCGNTCCLECVYKIWRNRLDCPFCHILFKNIKLFPNLPLSRLLDQELIKIENQLDPKEKERLLKNEANKRLQEQIMKMVQKNLQDPAQAIGGLADGSDIQTIEQITKEKEDPLLDVAEGRKHTLFDKLENSKFFLMKAPIEEFFIMGVRNNEWCVSKKAADKIKATQNQPDQADNPNVLLFISIKNSNLYQGVCRVLDPQNPKPVSENWLKVYPGSYHYTFSIQWLSFPEFSYSKTKSIMNPLKDNEPLNKFRDADEITYEIGVQMCKMSAEQEKVQLSSGAQSKYRLEYFRWKTQNRNIPKEEKKEKKPQDEILYNGLTQKENEIYEKYIQIEEEEQQDEKSEEAKEPLDITMSIYEDLASPSMLKSKSKKKDDKLDKSEEKSRKTRDQDDHLPPKASIQNQPIQQQIPSYIAPPMIRPTYYNYPGYAYPPNMMHQMYHHQYQGPMMGRPMMQNIQPPHPMAMIPQPQGNPMASQQLDKSEKKDDKRRSRSRSKKKHSKRSKSPYKKDSSRRGKRSRSRSRKHHHHSRDK